MRAPLSRVRNAGASVLRRGRIDNFNHNKNMGLDTSHGCWHGAYSAFNRWRIEIAKAAGLPPLDLMEGFWGSPRAESPPCGLPLSIKCAANMLKRATYEWSPKQPGEAESHRPHESLLSAFDFDPIRWDCLKPDPLHELLHHSDCEGEIPWESCEGIADSLERILPNLPDEDAGGHIGNWRDKTQQFINGLRLAAEQKENVEFH